MKSGTKLGIAVIVVLVFATVLFNFQTLLWTKSYARERAIDFIQSKCKLDGRNPDLLSGLRQDTIPRKISFEKTYQGKPRYLYGIWFHSDGSPEFYGGDPDDPNSAAYDHTN